MKKANNPIFMPTLKSISLKNFSLYPNGLKYKYDFVEGVNLIIGGNGMGKTTFINLIKYAIIGLYKREIDVRTYKGEKREKRLPFNKDYFKNRMDQKFDNNKSAKITISFNINKTTFTVTRNLYDIKLEKVIIKDGKNKKELKGKIISQFEYEKIDSDNQQKYLQYKYEQTVATKANLFSFDDMIFFVNEILLLDENRKTILWDNTAQEKLSSKYFNEPGLDNQREESLRQAKYYDSLARHNSEDIRAIRNVLKNMENTNKFDSITTDKIKLFDKLKSENDTLAQKIDKVHAEREEIMSTREIKLAEKSKCNKRIDNLEKKIRKSETSAYKNLFDKLNPKYEIFYKNIKRNKICPMCNGHFVEDDHKKIINEDNNCFLCHSEIKNKKLKKQVDPRKIIKMKNDLRELEQVMKNIEADISQYNDKVQTFDDEYDKIGRAKYKVDRDLRNLKHLLQKDQENQEDKSINAMFIEMSRLEKLKKNNQKKSEKYKKTANEIIDKINTQRVEITKGLSNYFSDFSNKFLGLDSYITYDKNYEGQKCYMPVIAGKARMEEEELSESQRFFIDQSFRMSLLNYFYRTPSFLICETPDSSLDISYEQNAANIFLKFLEHPNVLILTSNFNNSAFLEHIIDKAKILNCINLLDIGQKSSIQNESLPLKRIAKKISNKIQEIK